MKQFACTVLALFLFAALAGNFLVHFRVVDMVLTFALTYATIQFFRELYFLDQPADDWIDELMTAAFILLLAMAITVLFLGLLIVIIIP